MSPLPCCLSRDHKTRLCVWEPSAVCRRSYIESTSLLATLCTPERQSLCESHRQRRWLTYWSYDGLATRSSHENRAQMNGPTPCGTHPDNAVTPTRCAGFGHAFLLPPPP